MKNRKVKNRKVKNRKVKNGKRGKNSLMGELNENTCG